MSFVLNFMQFFFRQLFSKQKGKYTFFLFKKLILKNIRQNFLILKKEEKEKQKLKTEKERKSKFETKKA